MSHMTLQLVYNSCGTIISSRDAAGDDDAVYIPGNSILHELFKRNTCLSIHLGSVFVLERDLLGYDFLITLAHDSDQEVEEDNEVEELIQEPEQPNHCDHCACCFWIGLHMVHPMLVYWRSNVSNRISVNLQEVDDGHFNVGVVSSILQTLVLHDLVPVETTYKVIHSCRSHFGW